MRTAAPKDRQYLESLNLKALQKQRKPDGQPAREFYEALQQEAKEGPLFGADVLRAVAGMRDLPKPVTKWLGNLKDFKDVEPRDLNLIVDWVNGDDDAGRELQPLTWSQAVEAQQYWHENEFAVSDSGAYNTHDVVFSTGGYDFVEVTDPEDLTTEGKLMGHCVGRPEYADAVKSGDAKIYSLRDSKDHPHVTIEVNVHGESVQQCYGKQNKVPVQKYNVALVKFFEHMKLWDGVLHLKDAKVPDHVWQGLTGHSNYDVRAYVAKSPNTPSDVLKLLAKDSDWVVRRYVAGNRNTPSDVLKLLAKDSDNFIRWTIAKNSNTPSEGLKLLAKDRDSAVRRYVAGNRNTPSEGLKLLAKDRDWTVRRYVAENPNTPSDVLKLLASDSDAGVRNEVARNPNYKP